MATQSQSDVIKWQLDGIARDKEATQARLKYLEEQEALLLGRGMTGTPTPAARKANGKAPKAKSGKRKLSAEARQKMSDAQKERWAIRKGTAAAAATATDAPPPVAAPPVASATA